MVVWQPDVKPEPPEPKRCRIAVKATWDTGEKVELDMVDISPDVMPDLIAFLRERRAAD